MKIMTRKEIQEWEKDLNQKLDVIVFYKNENDKLVREINVKCDECNEEIKYQKKRLLILKQQLLQLYGEKNMEKQKGRVLKK